MYIMVSTYAVNAAIRARVIQKTGLLNSNAASNQGYTSAFWLFKMIKIIVSEWHIIYL
jgi:hypothetical protein